MSAKRIVFKNLFSAVHVSTCSVIFLGTATITVISNEANC